MPSSIRELHIESDLTNLTTVAEFVAGCCKQWQVDEGNIYKIQLAVDEAVTNIIEHAYESGPGEIVLRCWVAEHHFYVELIDRGKSFALEDVPKPTLSGPLVERRTGGLGLHFMHQLMDEVDFRVEKDRNVLNMVKYNVSR